MTRPSGRKTNEMRELTLRTNTNAFAEGSCLIECGQTKVMCTATVEERVPVWMIRDKKPGGWITAEYGMLPRATQQRVDREAVRGKQQARSIEIQRLIGRSIRSVVDLKKLGQRTIWLDCDVLQADGGTRTAAITGAFVALELAIKNLIQKGKLESSPIKENLAAISCGITVAGPVIDLDYAEDSNALTDANFVITESGGLVEVQATGEDSPMQPTDFNTMLQLAQNGTKQLIDLQKQVVAAS